MEDYLRIHNYLRIHKLTKANIEGNKKLDKIIDDFWTDKSDREIFNDLLELKCIISIDGVNNNDVSSDILERMEDDGK